MTKNVLIMAKVKVMRLIEVPNQTELVWSPWLGEYEECPVYDRVEMIVDETEVLQILDDIVEVLD